MTLPIETWFLWNSRALFSKIESDTNKRKTVVVLMTIKKQTGCLMNHTQIWHGIYCQTISYQQAEIPSYCLPASFAFISGFFGCLFHLHAFNVCHCFFYATKSRKVQVCVEFWASHYLNITQNKQTKLQTIRANWMLIVFIQYVRGANMTCTKWPSCLLIFKSDRAVLYDAMYK